jgi:hypothetical protein
VLTFFTAPKPFVGHVGVIQRNALRSWAAMPGSEILVFGVDEGSAEIAAELGAVHVPNVASSPQGTPLVGDMFTQARALARNDVLCFINADVIVTSRLPAAVRRVEGRRFLLVGRRWDLDIREELEFRGDWEAELERRVRADGRLHPPAGSDYFAYPRDVDWQMPAFAIGRVGWDNWALHRARELSLDVIDASAVVDAIHQDHDYLPAQRPEGDLHDAPEAAENLRLLAGRIATLNHTTHVLTDRWLLPALQPSKLIGRAISTRFVSGLRRRLRAVKPF